MSNIKKYCLYTAIYSVGFMFCSGAIMQTFLLQAGFSAGQVYALSSLIQIAQVVMMAVMTFLSDKIKQVRKVSGIAYLSLTILASVFLLGAINPAIVRKPYVIAVFIATGICYLGAGVYNILAYCIPYYTIDMKDYGIMTGLSVALSGGFTFAVSFLHSIVVARFNYMQAMAWFFVLAIVCFILTSVICLSMKEIPRQGEVRKTSKEDMIAVFKNKSTYILLLPNFTRGLAMGIVSVITVIALSKGLFDERSSSYINLAMCVAMLLGNLFYSYTCKKISSATYLLITSIGVGLFLPFCLSGGRVLFLIAFVMAYLFIMIAGTAIPVAVTEIIPERQIGAYTSIRMLIFTGGQAVAPMIIAPFTRVIGNTGLMIFATVMQVICTFTYYVVAVYEKRKKQKVEVEIQESAQA